MIEFIKVCGVFGLLILLVTVLLLAAGILVAGFARSRKPLVVLALLAVLPLLLGLMGTAIGHAHVAQAAKQTASPELGLVQRGREQARYTTYLGLGCSLLLLGLIGMTGAIKKPAEESDAVNAASGAPRS